jgi:hypothetical protein
MARRHGKRKNKSGAKAEEKIDAEDAESAMDAGGSRVSGIWGFRDSYRIPETPEFPLRLRGVS